MKIEMVMPQMGESIAEGTILKWTKQVGDSVKKDENILEISTDKVDSEIPAPVAGVLVELKAKEGETVPVGQVIAILETEVGGATTAAPKPAPAAAAPVPAAPAAAQTASQDRPASPAPAPRPSAPAPAPSQPLVPVGGGATMDIPRSFGGRFFSPLVRAIARTEGVALETLAALPGSGRGGRVTKEDLLRFVSSGGARTAIPTNGGAAPMPTPGGAGSGTRAPMPAPAGAKAFETYPKFQPTESRTTGDGRIDVLTMDNMRQKIAEHMARSKQVSPHVYSVTEVDMTRVVRHRERMKAEFQARHGFSLTYTTYLIQATVQALLDYPVMNSSIDGTSVLVKRFIHFGVAVALESGLIVPVIKHAEEKNFLGLARALQDLAGRARSKQLKPDEVSGGTFTLTNMGSFGNLFGVPIINQPQVGILGVGAIVKRPVIVEDMIAVRDIMYLSLSYDHRIVDGMLGGLFIERVRHYLENGDLPESI